MKRLISIAISLIIFAFLIIPVHASAATVKDAVQPERTLMMHEQILERGIEILSKKHSGGAMRAVKTEFQIVIETEDDPITPGDTVVISITVPEGLQASTMQFGVDYDSTKLTSLGAVAGEAMTGLGAVTINTEISGKIYIAWDTYGTPLNQAGSILNMSFQAKEGALGTVPISFDLSEDFILTDLDYNMLPVSLINGGVTIVAHIHSFSEQTTAPTCTEQGFTTHTCSCGYKFIDNISEPLGHSYGIPTWEWTEISDGYSACACFECLRDELHQQHVDAVVQKSIPNPSTTRYTASVEFESEIYTDIHDVVHFLYGDTNLDGSVDASDAAALLRHVVKLVDLNTAFGSQTVINGDVDGREGLTAADAACILRKAVQLMSHFPVEG